MGAATPLGAKSIVTQQHMPHHVVKEPSSGPHSDERGLCKPGKARSSFLISDEDGENVLIKLACNAGSQGNLSLFLIRAR